MNAEQIISNHVKKKLEDAARRIKIYPVSKLPVYECPVCQANHAHDFLLNFYQQPLRIDDDQFISAEDARVIKDVIVFGTQKWLLDCKEQTGSMVARFNVDFTNDIISVETECFYMPAIHRCQEDVFQ